MALRISVFESPELQATILALKGMDKELAKQLRAATKTVTEAEWRTGIAAYAHTPLEHKVMVQSARVAVTNQNVTLKAGTLSTRLSGGGQVKQLSPGVEFGGNQAKVQGKRHTQRQFKARNRKGYVAYPAAADLIPRIASLWVATVVRSFHEALEKGTH